MSQAIVNLDMGKKGLLEHLASKGVPIDGCYQCLRCGAGCPMLSFMDFSPNKIIRMLQFGMEEDVLKSKTIWMCASCQTCSTRCPNNVEIAHMMDILRQEGNKRNVPCPEPMVEKFHRVFINEIKRGRIHELSLIGKYKLMTGRFAQDMDLGIEMFKKGRMKLIPSRLGKNPKVKRLFDLAKKGD